MVQKGLNTGDVFEDGGIAYVVQEVTAAGYISTANPDAVQKALRTKAEVERIAAEQAEQERIAQEQAEAEEGGGAPLAKSKSAKQP